MTSQVNAAEAGILAGRETLRGTEETVLQNTVQAYLDVRRDQEAVTANEDSIKLLKTYLDETQARFNIGEITRTDVAATEASVLAAETQLSAARGQLANSRASYLSVVGQDPGDLDPAPSLTRLLPLSLDQAFHTAERNSPLLRGSQYTEESSAAKVAEAKAQTRPTVSLQANLGYNGGAYGLSDPFVDYSHDVRASILVTFPIFTGGTTSSQIRQATETNTVDRIGIDIARRQMVLTVSQAWNQLQTTRAALTTNEAAVKAADIAFEGTRLEARVGLRSTLEVLSAEQSLTNAKLAVLASRHDEYVASATLLAAAGALSVADLTSSVKIYDAKANFDHVRHAYPWAPWAPVVSAIDHIGAPGIQELPAPAPIPAPSPSDK